VDDSSTSGPSQTSTTFAERLDYLFRARRSPRDGRPYKQNEVAAATGISPAYLSQLRSGAVKMPSGDRVQALAAFFGVAPEYFTGVHVDPARAAAGRDSEIERALSKPLVREVALRAGELGEGERALILEMMERASERAAQIRARRDAQESSPPESEHGRTE
jgi:transcriptional regulator with XRE-family HTH domain